MTYYLVINPQMMKDTKIDQPLAMGRRPSMLVSYYYQNQWPRLPEQRAWCRSWCLDSGGFTAFTKGATINIDEFAAYARDVWQADPTLDQVFTLDNILSWQETRRNTDHLIAAGVPVVPIFHVGEPMDVLVGYARDYPKIALGGMVPLKAKRKREFIDACFNRIWPAAVHGLGVGGSLMMAAPWHSVDASNWTRALRWRRWNSFGGAAMRGPWCYDIRIEAEVELKREELASHRWRVEMETLRTRLAAAGWRNP